jgi:hypothetical protein
MFISIDKSQPEFILAVSKYQLIGSRAGSEEVFSLPKFPANSIPSVLQLIILPIPSRFGNTTTNSTAVVKVWEIQIRVFK